MRLTLATRLGFHMMLGVGEFIRGDDSTAQGVQRVDHLQIRRGIDREVLEVRARDKLMPLNVSTGTTDHRGEI